jgi:hypothetical protein
MKRLLLLIFTALIVFAVNAQQSFTYFRTTPSTVTLPAGNGWWRYYNPDHKIQVRLDGSLQNIATENWSLSQFWKTSGTSTLTGDVDIQGTNFGVDFDFTFGTDYSWGYWKNDQVYLGMADENFEHISGLQLQKGAAKLEAGAIGGGYMSMTLATGGTPAILVNASGLGTFRGITYPSDISANYTSRSLVDKGYVDALVAGVSIADGDKGNITVSSSGTSWLVDEDINKAWTGTHSFIDNNFTLLDNSDNTKIAKFELSGIGAGITRTITIPNVSGTMVVGSGVASRIAFWSDVNTISNSADFTFDGTNKTQTLGGTITTSGTTSLDVTKIWNAASGTGTNRAIYLRQTLNTTGTYSGISYGIDYDPTLTSTTGLDHIAMRLNTGRVLIGSNGNNGSTTDRVSIYGIASGNVLTLRDNGAAARWSFVNNTGGIIHTPPTTSGANTAYNLVGGFDPSSGTNTWRAFNITSTFNTTGTYVGSSVGYGYSPTRTSVTGLTEYAAKFDGGLILFGASSSDVIFSTNTKLDVRGLGAGSDLIARFASSGSVSRFQVQGNGLFTFTSASRSNTVSISHTGTATSQSGMIWSGNITFPNLSTAVLNYHGITSTGFTTNTNQEYNQINISGTIQADHTGAKVRGIYINNALTGTQAASASNIAIETAGGSIISAGQILANGATTTQAPLRLSGVNSYTGLTNGDLIYDVDDDYIGAKLATGGNVAFMYSSGGGFITNAIPFMVGNALDGAASFSSSFTFDGSTFTVPDMNLTGTATIDVLDIDDVPTNDNALTQVLVRDGSNGIIKYRDASSLGGVSGSSTAGRLAYWDGTSSIKGEVDALYDESTNTLSIGNLSLPTSGTFLGGDIALTGANIQLGISSAGASRVIQAEGSASDIDIILVPKGTGEVQINGNASFTTGVDNNGTGFKHGRVTTGSIGAGSSALVTLTWGSGFANTNYTVTADVEDSTTSTSSLKVVHIESKTTGSVVVRVENTSGGSLTGTLNVIAIHD